MKSAPCACTHRVVLSPCRDVTSGETTTHEADALVFAVGITGMQKIVQANPTLGSRPEFRRMMNLRGIDVVSTRLWLDKRIDTQFPANVLAGFEDNMGSTYFNLNDLQVRITCRLLPVRACAAADALRCRPHARLHTRACALTLGGSLRCYFALDAYQLEAWSALSCRTSTKT